MTRAVRAVTPRNTTHVDVSCGRYVTSRDDTAALFCHWWIPRGAQGARPLGPISFTFMQFSIIGWRPLPRPLILDPSAVSDITLIENITRTVAILYLGPECGCLGKGADSMMIELQVTPPKSQGTSVSSPVLYLLNI